MLLLLLLVDVVVVVFDVVVVAVIVVVHGSCVFLSARIPTRFSMVSAFSFRLKNN